MSAELFPGIAFSPQTTITNNIGAADTIIEVSDISAFPPAPNLATIGTDEEGETILYAAKTSTALSGCKRGIEGTARAWMAGDVIGRNFTAKDHADLIDAVSDAVAVAQAAVQGAAQAEEVAQDAADAVSSALENLVAVPSGGEIAVPGTLGEGPYTFEFEEDGEGSAVSAAQVSYDGSESGLDAETVQGAVDLLSSRKADANRVSNPNLLDNWYFADPVNQRGQTEYTTNGYTIDRWIAASLMSLGTVKIVDGGIELSHLNDGGYIDFSFLFEEDINDVITASVLTGDGRLLCKTGIPSNIGASGGSPDIYMSGKTGFCIRVHSGTQEKLIAAKLELGPAQTLAHQDADGNWVLNDPPPDKALELLKCQRYQVFGPIDSVHTTRSGQISVAHLPLAVPLRGIPTIVGNPAVWAVDGNARIENVTITAEYVRNNGVLLYIRGSNIPCYASFGSGAGLDANL